MKTNLPETRNRNLPPPPAHAAPVESRRLMMPPAPPDEPGRGAAVLRSFFAMLIMNGLPRWYHPVFNWRRFSRATNDGFFLIIEARDPRFTELEARELLEQSGGTHVTIIHED